MTGGHLVFKFQKPFPEIAVGLPESRIIREKAKIDGFAHISIKSNESKNQIQREALGSHMSYWLWDHSRP